MKEKKKIDESNNTQKCWLSYTALPKHANTKNKTAEQEINVYIRKAFEEINAAQQHN